MSGGDFPPLPEKPIVSCSADRGGIWRSMLELDLLHDEEMAAEKLKEIEAKAVLQFGSEWTRQDRQGREKKYMIDDKGVFKQVFPLERTAKWPFHLIPTNLMYVYRDHWAGRNVRRFPDRLRVNRLKNLLEVLEILECYFDITGERGQGGQQLRRMFCPRDGDVEPILFHVCGVCPLSGSGSGKYDAVFDRKLSDQWRPIGISQPNGNEPVFGWIATQFRHLPPNACVCVCNPVPIDALSDASDDDDDYEPWRRVQRQRQ